MAYRIMVVAVVTCSLTMILGCGAGMVTLQRGVVPPQPISVRVGHIELAAFTEVVSSSMYPTHAYYTVWVFVRSDARPSPRGVQSLVWGRRFVRLEVPDPRRR